MHGDINKKIYMRKTTNSYIGQNEILAPTKLTILSQHQSKQHRVIDANFRHHGEMQAEILNGNFIECLNEDARKKDKRK